MDVINLQEKYELFDDLWTPKIIGELNGQQVKIAKVKGEFVWHDHANEDELFMVVKGELKIQFEGKESCLREGELCVVPKGVSHKPVAEEECWILLFEPKQTKHTGEVQDDLTVDKAEWI